MRTTAALLLLALMGALGGCSAVKAADKTGAEPAEVADCGTVACFQAHQTAETLESRAIGDGERFYRFRYQRRQGSMLRALGWGALGVYTLGLSEVITNPAENAIQNDEMFVVDALCTSSDERCHTVLMTLPGDETRVVRGDPEQLRARRGASDG